MPNPWSIAVFAGGLAGFALAVGGAYSLGRKDGAVQAELKAKSAVIEQLKERSEIDGMVEKLPADELCTALGGVWRNDRCE